MLSSICFSHEEACYEVDLFIDHFANISRKDLLMNPQLELPAEKRLLLEQKLQLRIEKRIPLQYITNKAYFYGLEFYVEPGVLIPRRDTEILVEQALKQIKKNHYTSLAEIGSGSGCISISILKNSSIEKAIATDISHKALEISSINSITHGVENILSLMATSYLDNVDEQFDIIISNPPYIPFSRLSGLSEEVKNHEPYEALFVNDDNPLEVYENILKQAQNRLKTGGYLAVEIDSTFCEQVYSLFQEREFQYICINNDYNTQPRVISGKKPN